MSSVTISNSIASYIVASDNFTLTNLGTIGKAATAVAVNGNADTVVNAGSIVGSNFGVQLGANALTNQSGGTISGAYGVVANNTASIVNYGGISGTLSGVNLVQGSLTNQSGGVILGGTSGYGAKLTSNATLLNAGDITAATGIYLQGGYATNQSGGTISGTDGAKIGLSATLTNGGNITGSSAGIVLSGTGSVVDLPGGTIAGGVSAGVGIYGVPNIYYNPFTSQTYFEGYLPGRGLVTNSGLISGAYGIRVRDVTATVVNKGTIEGVTAAVELAPGYSGKLIMYPGAVFNGLVEGAGGVLELASSATKGTIGGGGTQFTGFSNVTIDPGAYWTFASGDTFTGGVELTIAGTFGGVLTLSAGSHQAIEVQPGASILGTIDGGNTLGSTVYSELELLSGPSVGTLTGIGSNLLNFSDIEVSDGAYWQFNPNTFASGTTLINNGTVGATSGVSVAFLPGAGNRVEIGYGAEFLGTVDGGNPIGSSFASVLELDGSGSTLSGLGTRYLNFTQLVVDSGASEYLTTDNFVAGMTVTNAGTMSGPDNTAVVFAAGVGNRVILAPGGEFVGTVDGGNTLGSSIASTLELSGNRTGNLTGLGTQFVNFAQITVDPGAYWDLSGYNTIAPGAALTVSGHTYNYGSLYGNVTLAGGEMLNDGPLNGNVTLAGGTMLNEISGTITGEVLGVGAAGALANQGTIDGSGGTAVQLAAGFANCVTIFPSSVFGGVVNGNAPGLASLSLGSGSSAGTLVGFGTKYIGFGQIAVTSGADWSLGNTTTLAAGITLTNAGTVFGTPDAVRFAPGAGNRVVLEGNGTFTGTIDGGNTLGSPNVSTLELGAGGFGNATLSGLGSQFVNFGQINVDYGASWVLTSGLNTLASGVVLNVAGALDVYNRLVGNVTLSGGRLEVYRPGDSVTGSVIGVATSASVRDYGLIKGVGLAAVSLAQGGLVNLGTAAAEVSGATYGVVIAGNYGTVINSGFIVGSKIGVALGAGGTMADYGFIDGGITSGGAAIWLQSGGGTARIAAGKTVTGFIGVRADGPSTVINQGIINGGTGGAAVQFGAGATQRLVIDPGAVFRGTVDGGNTAGSTAVSTLELASSASIGTLSGLGSKYINFGSIVVDTNADWSLSGSNTVASGSVLTLTDASLSDSSALVNNGGVVLTPSSYLGVGGLLGVGTATIVGRSDIYVLGTLGAGETIAFSGVDGELGLANPGSIAGTIANFGYNEIDLFGVNPTSVSYSAGELHFTLPGGVGTGSIALTPAPGYSVSPAVSDPAGTGAAIYGNSILCFGAGTHIATPKGEVPVEQLAVNDVVLTSDGSMQPIIWIGTGRVMVPPGRRSAATPVIVRKSALASNVPHRDLHLTKGHSLCIDDVLIPVEFLVNHRSIVWDDEAREITIYHIELARHAVLLAEGAPAESYRDDGNRWLFENANSGWDLPPQEALPPRVDRRTCGRCGLVATAAPCRTWPAAAHDQRRGSAPGRRRQASGRRGADGRTACVPPERPRSVSANRVPVRRSGRVGSGA